MKIAQIQKQSLIEYPGKIAAVIFLAGCNLRCQFCYVPDLVLPERTKAIRGIPQEEAFSFLEERRGFLDGVAISGGEATLNPELPGFIKKIKEMGYLVELETNGTNSEMLADLIGKGLIDYVSMDIKQDFVFEKWREITGNVLTEEMFENIKRSIQIILEGRVDHQFRTTLIKEFHKKEDIIGISKRIKGAKVYYLQNYEQTEGGTISGRFFHPLPEEEISEIVEEGKKYVNIKARRYL